jgi:ElaB/YqjD/DUF883 family membrane-anchored ribosome-binding protein
MATDDINKEMNQIKADINALREDVASLVRALKDAGMEQGRQAYDQAYESVRQAGESVGNRASDAYSAFGREVEQRPLTSVLSAFGIGFVVGMLLDHRHR